MLGRYVCRVATTICLSEAHFRFHWTQCVSTTQYFPSASSNSTDSNSATTCAHVSVYVYVHAVWRRQAVCNLNQPKPIQKGYCNTRKIFRNRNGSLSIQVYPFVADRSVLTYSLAKRSLNRIFAKCVTFFFCEWPFGTSVISCKFGVFFKKRNQLFFSYLKLFYWHTCAIKENNFYFQWPL